ncbi:MAG: sulfotransferase domain-containing protein [Lyngbya sp.]|nr:sulfotransferase domain-containing protein [Lyngbya sp.]
MVKQFVKKAVYQVYPLIKSPPDFLIIGVQRAGTTSLYEYLTQHSQVVVTRNWKETYYFDVPENYSQGFKWYLGNFPSKFKKGNKLTFEASPSYIYHQNIPQRIKHDLGDIKMIALLRNPVDRAYSAWQMYHSYSYNPHQHLRNRADERSFFEAIQQELNPELNQAKYPYNYLNRGKYVEQLENYYTYFNREKILLLSFDDFCQNLESVLNQVCNFLEIDSFSLPQIEKFRQEKHAAAPYKTNPQDNEVMAKLQDYFLPFNERLYNLVNRDYGW